MYLTDTDCKVHFKFASDFRKNIWRGTDVLTSLELSVNSRTNRIFAGPAHDSVPSITAHFLMLVDCSHGSRRIQLLVDLWLASNSKSNSNGRRARNIGLAYRTVRDSSIGHERTLYSHLHLSVVSRELCSS